MFGQTLKFGILAMALLAAEKGTSITTEYQTAIFAGGCFWCMEHPFEKLDGVAEVISGYTGGDEIDPTYEEVSSGQIGHLEAVKVVFDPSKISYVELLDVFWRQIDPTDSRGQFVDRGVQYGTAIFYDTAEQKKLAEESRKELNESGRYKKPIVTEVRKAGEFYDAEGYHQDYYKTNPLRYKFYRFNSGRDRYLESVWQKRSTRKNDKLDEYGFKKPTPGELKEKLTPLQYRVTQKEGTERPFDNEYWENKRQGIYVDIVSGEPLFSSLDKFESGTGWPSFTKALIKTNIIKLQDSRFFTTRTEVRSKNGDSHLGHLFDDGPKPIGNRYCINSAALRFIPKEELKSQGYEKFIPLFNSTP